MKLSSKLPQRNGLDESDLPADLLSNPTRARLIVVEVACGKTETTFDEYGDPFTIPTAQVVSAEYLTDPRDISTAQLLARRAFDRRRGTDTLPGVESVVREFHDSMASTMRVGESMTLSAVGKSATIHGERVDPETGEVYDGEAES